MRGCTLFYETILNKAPLKILTLLSLHPDEELYEREICQETGLASGTVNQLMRELLAAGLVAVERKGKMNFYQVLPDLPLVRQHRTWDNLLKLQPLVQVLKKHCSRIVLYGSCAAGTDTHKSDLDILLVSEESQEKLKRIIGRHKELCSRIKPVIYKLSDYAALVDEEPVFYKELKKGILLYEKAGNNGDEL